MCPLLKVFFSTLNHSFSLILPSFCPSLQVFFSSLHPFFKLFCPRLKVFFSSLHPFFNLFFPRLKVFSSSLHSFFNLFCPRLKVFFSRLHRFFNLFLPSLCPRLKVFFSSLHRFFNIFLLSLCPPPQFLHTFLHSLLYLFFSHMCSPGNRFAYLNGLILYLLECFCFCYLLINSLADLNSSIKSRFDQTPDISNRSPFFLLFFFFYFYTIRRLTDECWGLSDGLKAFFCRRCGHCAGLALCDYLQHLSVVLGCHCQVLELYCSGFWHAVAIEECF